MIKSFPSLVEILIVAYCLFQIREVLTTWDEAPLEKWGWVALILWMLPALVFWALPERPVNTTTPSLIISGLVVSLIGTMGSLNFLHHVGFTLALAGLLPMSWKLAAWIPLTVTWMPAFGWIGSRFMPEALPLLRISVALLGCFWAVYTIYTLKSEPRNEES